MYRLYSHARLHSHISSCMHAHERTIHERILIPTRSGTDLSLSVSWTVNPSISGQSIHKPSTGITVVWLCALAWTIPLVKATVSRDPRKNRTCNTMTSSLTAVCGDVTWRDAHVEQRHQHAICQPNVPNLIKLSRATRQKAFGKQCWMSRNSTFTFFIRTR